MGITQSTPLKNYSVAYFWGKNTGFICKTSSDQGSAVANETHANICPNPFLCVTSSSTPICDRALKWKITAQCTEIIQTITKLLLHAYAHMQHPAFSSGRAWLAHQSQKPWDKESKLGGEKNLLGASYKHKNSQYFSTFILWFWMVIGSVFCTNIQWQD